MEKNGSRENFLKVLLALVVIGMLAQTYFIVKLYTEKEGGSAAPAASSAKTRRTAQPQIPLNFLPPAQNAGQQQSGINNLLPQAQPQGQAPSPQAAQIPHSGFSISSKSPQLMNQMMAWGDDSFFDRDPFEEMREMMAQMMQGGTMAFPSIAGGMAGLHDGTSIREEKDKYVVEMKIPGLEKSEVKTEVSGGMLTVSGIQREETAVSSNGQVTSRSFSSRHFQSSTSLPGPVKADGIKVNYKDDTLTITIPKA